MAARVRCQILERCGDIVVTFREGAASDQDVGVAYSEGQRRNREGITRLCARLQTIGALNSALSVTRAADQVAALRQAVHLRRTTRDIGSDDTVPGGAVHHLPADLNEALCANAAALGA